MTADKTKAERFVIVRGDLAGVMTGYLEALDEKFIVLREARQFWQFGGAETLTGVAQCGASMERDTRIDKAAPRATIPIQDVGAILDCTPEAEANLRQERWL